jgi:hypothetical protein
MYSEAVSCLVESQRFTEALILCQQQVPSEFERVSSLYLEQELTQDP